MATTTQVATRALRRLGVLTAEETITAADLSAATDALNAMVSSWEASALSGDTLPLDARFESAIVAMLAVRLAEEYGRTVGPVLARDADEGWAAILGAFFHVPTQTFDAGLLSTAQNRYSAALIGQITGDYAAWQSATNYAVMQSVINSGSVYECITAGVSGTGTGPAGTGTEIADGTVVWCWRRVS